MYRRSYLTENTFVFEHGIMQMLMFGPWRLYTHHFQVCGVWVALKQQARARRAVWQKKGQRFTKKICLLSALPATQNKNMSPHSQMTYIRELYPPESPLASAERKLLQDSRKKTDVSSNGLLWSLVNLVRWTGELKIIIQHLTLNTSRNTQ